MQNIYELYDYMTIYCYSYYILWYIYIIYCANVHTDLWKKWRMLITLDNDFWVNKLEGGCNPRKNIHEFYLVSARGTSHSSSLILATATSRADTWWIETPFLQGLGCGAPTATGTGCCKRHTWFPFLCWTWIQLLRSGTSTGFGNPLPFSALKGCALR